VSVATCRRILFVAGFFLLPFPVFGLGPGLVPAARFLMLAGVSAAFAVLESAAGVVLLLTATFLVQAMLYGAVVWGLAWALARLVGQLAPLARQRAMLLIVLLSLGYFLLNPVYRTPFSPDRAQSSLAELYR
jgi:hypothetical protein